MRSDASRFVNIGIRPNFNPHSSYEERHDDANRIIAEIISIHTPRMRSDSINLKY